MFTLTKIPAGAVHMPTVKHAAAFSGGAMQKEIRRYLLTLRILIVK